MGAEDDPAAAAPRRVVGDDGAIGERVVAGVKGYDFPIGLRDQEPPVASGNDIGRHEKLAGSDARAAPFAKRTASPVEYHDVLGAAVSDINPTCR